MTQLRRVWPTLDPPHPSPPPSTLACPSRRHPWVRARPTCFGSSSVVASTSRIPATNGGDCSQSWRLAHEIEEGRARRLASPTQASADRSLGLGDDLGIDASNFKATL